MSEVREFPTLVVASTVVQRALCEMAWSDFRDCAQWLFGGLIWTHEFAHEPTVDAIREEGYRQFPYLPTQAEADRDVDNAARLALAGYGPTVRVERGTHGRRESPTDTARAMGVEGIAFIEMLPLIMPNGGE